MIRWVRPSNLSPCLTPFGKYTLGFVCLNLIIKSCLWLTECVLSHCGGLFGAHPRTRTDGRPKPPPCSAGGSVALESRHVFAICPPQKHRRPSFDSVFLLHHPAPDVLLPRPVEAAAESEALAFGWHVTSGAMLPAERAQNVHGHVS